MLTDQQRNGRASSPGISDLIKGLFATLIGMLQTRLEIVATELEEERERLEEYLLMAVGFIFCLCMGMVLLSFLIAVIFWDTPVRLLVIGLMAVFYFLVAGGLGAYLRRSIKDKPSLFAETIAELKKDRDLLKEKLSS